MTARLPNGWMWTKIEDVALVDGGLTKNAAKRATCTITAPLVSVAAVKLRKIDISAIGTISLLDSDRNKGLLSSNDILVVEGNGSLAHIGRVALWNLDIPNARHQNHIIRVRATQVEPRFLLEWLASPHGRDAIVEKATTAAGLYTLSLSKIETLPVPLPPINEQRRIVGKIEALFERSRWARQALDAIPPLIERLRQSILAAAFRGDLTADWRAKHPDVEPADRLLQRIRAERRHRWEQAHLAKLKAKGKKPKDDSWKAKYKDPEPVASSGLPELPLGWVYFRLPEIVEASADAMKTGPFGSLLKKADYLAGGIPILGVENVRAMQFIDGGKVYISQAKAAELTKYDARPGDILVSRSGTVGEVCVVPEGIGESRISTNLMRIRLIADSLLPQLFCMAFNGSPFVLDQVARLCSGSTRDFLNQSILSRIILPMPPLHEQRAMIHAVQAAFVQIKSSIVKANRSVSALARLEQGILAKAFRGKLVPQDPDDEPASVLLERIRAARQNTPQRGKRARSSPENNLAKPRAKAKARPEPEAPARANAQPEPEQMALGLEHHEPEEIQNILYSALWGLGPLELDAAVRTVADALREQGLVHYKKLRADGALYATVKKAIDTAVRAGYLDRPRRGHVRAVEPSAREYTTDDWRTALLAALDGEPVDRDQAVARTAEWARDNMGLAFQRLRTGGVIESGIKSAIRSAIRRGDIERTDRTRIQARIQPRTQRP